MIRQGHIAPGDVDERSIEDVVPNDLASYTQCHFFAGIGVWSYALRQADWPDDRPVWTGSCPCQPFSAAGKVGGFDDERHLWPAWFWLISQSRPDVVFGEQVASRDGLAWLDLVQADMEGAGYAIGALDLCAAGFGAPHRRQRLFFVADAESKHRGTGFRNFGQATDARLGRIEYCHSRTARSMADTSSQRLSVRECQELPGSQRDDEGRAIEQCRGASDRMDNTDNSRPERSADQIRTRRRATNPPGPTNGFWQDADWLWCRDEKYRPVEPGTFPLAHGSPARVGRLRGYSNAIVAPVAAEFIKAFMQKDTP